MDHHGLRLSAFDVIGPVMVGPSSSHTAGAARLGLMAARLLGERVTGAEIELHGSFAATGRGHATDRAVLAGILGFPPDDLRLPNSFAIAAEAGMAFTFSSVDLGEAAHPNTALLRVRGAEGRVALRGASLGGGVIKITRIDNFTTAFHGGLETLVLWHTDERGFLARITSLLAAVDVNIATLRTARERRGDHALTVVEIDGKVDTLTLGALRAIPALKTIRHLPPLP